MLIVSPPIRSPDELNRARTLDWVRIGIINHLVRMKWLLLPHEDLVLDTAPIALPLPMQPVAMITPVMTALAWGQRLAKHKSKFGLTF